MEKTNLFQKALWRLNDIILQWTWFLFRIDPQYIGFDNGLLTWLRRRRHRRLKKKVHICLLEYNLKGGKFGRFTEFWINERSQICTVSLNAKVEYADIIWIYSQDPLSQEIKEKIMTALRKAKNSAVIINHPDVYDVYHERNTFQRLFEVGVNVPRTTFTTEDMNKTIVVYKAEGQQASDKFISPYFGEYSHYRAFEFIDSRGIDGLYRRYRAYFIVGIVRPSKAMFSNIWNVCVKNMKRLEYTFQMTETEIDQVKLIAKTLNLQYFAVDFLRRKGDDLPVFTDINVYPMVISLTETGRHLGYHGRWHTFDTRERLGIPEPTGRPFWDLFDEAILSFAQKKPAQL